MINAQSKKVEETLDLINKVFVELMPTEPQDFQIPDITMHQFRIALFLYICGTMRMSYIAQILGVSTATATGIVDRLVEHDIVQREHDKDDRRAVICRLSPHGKKVISQIWQTFRNNTKKILMAIPESKLHLVDETLQLLLETGKNIKKDQASECKD